jgi:hypothetical protein
MITAIVSWIVMGLWWALAYWFYWGAGSTLSDKFLSLFFLAMGLDLGIIRLTPLA